MVPHHIYNFYYMEKIKFEFTKMQMQEIVTCILFRYDSLVRNESVVKSALSFDDRSEYFKDLLNELHCELVYLNSLFSYINDNVDIDDKK